MTLQWDRSKVESAVAEHQSYRRVLQALGISPTGGSYAMLKRIIAEMGLNTSHMTHQGHNAGKVQVTAKGKEGLLALLVENSHYQSTHSLKLRCWKYGLLEKRCYECGLTEWRGKEAPLQLDHINGERTDNRLENLRILCPNCHAQTDTWTGKNSRETRRAGRAALNGKSPKPRKQGFRPPKKEYLCECGQTRSPRGKTCMDCYSKNRCLIDWPASENLFSRVAEVGFEAVGRELGVSGNAIRKRLKNHPARVV